MGIMIIGDCVIDYYKNIDRSFIAGSGLNTAVYLKNKGLDSDLIGVIGDDSKADRILRYLKDNNFNINNLIQYPGETAQALIERKNNDFTIKRVAEGVKGSYRFEKDDLEEVKNYDIVHTNVYTYSLDFLPFLKENNDLVSFDYSFKADYKKILENQYYIDILFLSGDLTENEISILKRADIKYIVITAGNKGFITLFEDKEIYKKPEGEEIKDSIGAGDILIAEFLLGIYYNKNIVEIINEAAKRAYQSCLRIGPMHNIK